MRIKIFLLFAFTVAAVCFYLYGRALWNPLYVKIVGKRTVSDVISIYGENARARILPHFKKAEVAYPPSSLTLLAIKETGSLEVWANEPNGSVFISNYPIKAQSGYAGPKLREGDHQVPEGLYRIEGLNPNSSFHLSLKLNYPNEFDLKHAKIEGRIYPGSNIFIHGSASSVGCLAMGDPAIEELFVLIDDVGRQKTNVVIAPTDPRLAPLERVQSLPWTEELYTDIEFEFAKYDTK